MDTNTPPVREPMSQAALEAELAELEMLDDALALGELEDMESRPNTDRLIVNDGEATDNQGHPIIRIGEQV